MPQHLVAFAAVQHAVSVLILGNSLQREPGYVMAVKTATQAATYTHAL